MNNLEIFKRKLDEAMCTSYATIRAVLDEAWSAENWQEGEYIQFLLYVDEFIM